MMISTPNSHWQRRHSPDNGENLDSLENLRDAILSFNFELMIPKISLEGQEKPWLQ